LYQGIRQSLGRFAVTALLTISAVLPAAATGGKFVSLVNAGAGKQRIFFNQRTGQATTTFLAPDGNLKVLRSSMSWLPGVWQIACQREGT
jgi:hypothetical protein